jgi:Na+/melibiose symporter-like transporter
MLKLDTSPGLVEEVCVMLNYADVQRFFAIALPHALPTLVINHNEHVLQEISKRVKQNVCLKERKREREKKRKRAKKNETKRNKKKNKGIRARRPAVFHHFMVFLFFVGIHFYHLFTIYLLFVYSF